MSDPKLLESAAAYDHPCRETCSGWKQGYDKGFAFAMSSAEVLALVEALNDCALICSPDQRGHTQRGASIKVIDRALSAIAAFAKQPGGSGES